MIVDLLRMIWAAFVRMLTVRCLRCQVETYAFVHHLVSEVRELAARPGRSGSPAGRVSGRLHHRL